MQPPGCIIVMPLNEYATPRLHITHLVFGTARAAISRQRPAGRWQSSVDFKSRQPAAGSPSPCAALLIPPTTAETSPPASAARFRNPDGTASRTAAIAVHPAQPSSPSPAPSIALHESQAAETRAVWPYRGAEPRHDMATRRLRIYARTSDIWARQACW